MSHFYQMILKSNKEVDQPWFNISKMYVCPICDQNFDFHTIDSKASKGLRENWLLNKNLLGIMWENFLKIRYDQTLMRREYLSIETNVIVHCKFDKVLKCSNVMSNNKFFTYQMFFSLSFEYCIDSNLIPRLSWTLYRLLTVRSKLSISLIFCCYQHYSYYSHQKC